MCYFEVVSSKQCTYLDLDLKAEDCIELPIGLQSDRTNMAKQCLELLHWAYEVYLGIRLDMSHVTIGHGSGPDKISYHIMIYDGVHAWETGLSNSPPFSSGQKGFITLLKEEILRNPKRWNNLTYMDKQSTLSSVIETNPNSKGNQPFRTLLSAKIGTNLFYKV